MNKYIKCFFVLVIFFNPLILTVNAEDIDALREEVIQSNLQGPDIKGNELTKEEAKSYISKMESLKLNKVNLGNKNGYIFEEYLPEDYGLSHAQCINILDYLAKYYENATGISTVNVNGNNHPVYNQIINEYSLAIDDRIMEPRFPQNSMAIYKQAQDKSNSYLSYAYYDIDGNGADELLILHKNKIADLYTISPDNNVVKLIDDESYSERSSLTIYADHTMIAYGAGGANVGGYSLLAINADQSALQQLDRFDYDLMLNDHKKTYYRPSEPDKFYTKEEFEEIFKINQKKEVDLGKIEQHGLLNTQIENDTSAADANFSVPKDWYHNTKRDIKGVPRVLWPLLSYSNTDNTIVVEPIFADEKIVSGYTFPNTLVVTRSANDRPEQDTLDRFETWSDSNGYFEIKLNQLSFTSVVMIEVGKEAEMIEGMVVNGQHPTPLVHPSGKLTVERFFIDQDFVKGKTIPNIEVFIAPPDTPMTIVKSDANGEFSFQSEYLMTHDKHKTVAIWINDPNTNEKIEVIPYPWTQSELDQADW